MSYVLFVNQAKRQLRERDDEQEDRETNALLAIMDSRSFLIITGLERGTLPILHCSHAISVPGTVNSNAIGMEYPSRSAAITSFFQGSIIRTRRHRLSLRSPQTDTFRDTCATMTQGWWSHDIADGQPMSCLFG